MQSNCLAPGNTIKFGINGIRNPTNGVRTDPVTAYTFSSEYLEVALFDPVGDKLTIQTTEPGEILESNFNILQTTRELRSYGEFELKVKPTNPIPRLGWVEVEIPPQLGLGDDTADYSDP